VNIDEIYLRIAQNISDAIDQSWSVAIVQFEYEEDAGEFDCVYKIDESSDIEHDFEVNFETYKSFKELHAIMTQGDSNKWNRAKFTLYPTGKFNIDFEWDQSLADEVNSNS
jgi:hypothetical protein